METIDNNSINIIITDDHPLMRIGIKSMLTLDHPEMNVIGEAESGATLLELLKTLHPDIILLDILMPGMSGVEIVKILKKNYPDIKILMISSYTENNTLLDLVELGIDGFISKGQPAAELDLAVHDIVRGNSYFGADISKMIREVTMNKRHEMKGIDFTDKELAIIRLCCQGLISKEIADRLGISPRTVEGHKATIFKKIGFNTTLELVCYAIKNNIISLQ